MYPEKAIESFTNSEYTVPVTRFFDLWKGGSVMKEGAFLGFLLWMAGGGLLIALGIAAFFAKKEVGFFNNVKALPMENVKAYNRAVGKLYLVYGAVFLLLGLPILTGQNSPAVIFSVLGVVAETIVAMAVYLLAIQNKYEKK